LSSWQEESISVKRHVGGKKIRTENLSDFLPVGLLGVFGRPLYPLQRLKADIRLRSL
jgi:hypothetical protein